MSDLILRTGEFPAIDSQPMPIAFGECTVQCPVIYFHLRNDQQLEIGALISQLPIESVDAVWFDGTKIYPNPTHGFEVEIRTGNEELLLPSRLLTHPSWRSGLPRCAWVAILVDLGVARTSGGIPRVEADVHGATYAGNFTANPVRFIQLLLRNSGVNRVGSAFDAAATAVVTPAALAVQEFGAPSPEDPVIRRLLDLARCEMYYRVGGTMDETAMTIVRMDAPTHIGTASYSADAAVRLLAPPKITVDQMRRPWRVTGRYWDATARRWQQVAVEDGAASGAFARSTYAMGDIPATTYQDAMRMLVTTLNRRKRFARIYDLTADGTGEKATIGTTISLTIPGWTARTLQVIGQKIGSDGRVNLRCIEYSASDWDNGTYATQAGSPTTSQQGQMRFWVDDFLGGGSNGLPIGELGWQPNTAFAVVYTSEVGHDGIVEFGGNAECTLPVQLDSASTWSVNVVWKGPSPGSGAIYFGTQIAWSSADFTLRVGGNVIRSGAGGTEWYTILVTHSAGASTLKVRVMSETFSWAGEVALTTSTPRLGDSGFAGSVIVDRVTIAKVVT